MSKLRDQLFTFARQPPDPMLPAHLGSGHDRAGDLARAARGTPAETELIATIDALLQDSDWRCAWLAAVLCRVGDIDPAVIDAAHTQRTSPPPDPADGPAGLLARASVRGCWEMHLQAGFLPWKVSYRALLHEPGRIHGLLGPALVWDRAYVVSGLPGLLAGAENPVALFAWGISSTARRREAEDIRVRLVGRSDLPPGLVEAIDWYLVHDTLPPGEDRGAVGAIEET